MNRLIPRLVSLVLALALLGRLCLTAAAEEAALTVLVDGRPVVWTDARPVIDDAGRTLAPVRAIGEAMHLLVGWDAETRTARFSGTALDGSRRTIRMPVDSRTIEIEITTDEGSRTEYLQLDTAAALINERTYAPVRCLAEGFGWPVGWDGASRTVTIGRAPVHETRWLKVSEEVYYNDDLTSRSTYRYDEAGQLTETLLYDPAAGRTLPVAEYRYDAAGNKVAEHFHTLEGVYNYGSESVYDDAGNQTHLISYTTGRAVERTVERRYDEAANLLEEVIRHGDGSLDLHLLSTYDKAGNRLTHTSLDEAGGIRYTIESSYNQDGYLLTEVKTDYDGHKQLDHYTYNADNRLLLHTYEGHSVAIGSDYLGSGKVEYTYDEAGHLIRELHTDRSRTGDKVRHTDYTYSEAGHLLTVSEYDTAGALNSLLTYTVDDAGNILSRLKKDGAGRILQHVESSYDEAGILLREVTFTYDGVGNLIVSSELLKDPSSGKTLSKLTRKADGTLQDGTVYHYDAAAHLSEEIFYSDGEETNRIAYTHDKAGNLLTKSFRFPNGHLSRTEYRYEAVTVPAAEQAVAGTPEQG